MAEALVIGANGFIGSHLVDLLDAAGMSVTAFDRFSTGQPTFAAPAELLPGDFLSRSDIESAVAGKDYVFHFLSTTTPASAENDPTLDVRTNVAQTIELLEACVAAGVGHVYFGSTGGAIYGPQGRSEYSETDRALPVSPYAIGKLTIEHYLRYFRIKHGLHSTVLRVSNPYGTRQRASHRQGFIPIALRQIQAGRPVVQYGDGSMVRDYLFVDDLVTMIGAMVGRSSEFDLYNLGSGVGHSVSDILEVLRRVTGRDFEVVRRPQPSTFVDRVVLDTTRYLSEFGPMPLTALDDGVARTWAELDGEA